MQLTYEQYYDKVRGGWVGKCAGGILGAPIEGFKRFNKIQISDKLFETNFPNDDLDLQVLWLDMVMKKGVHVREKDFAEHWLRHVGFPWNEYGIATRNLKMGLLPPESGRLNNSYWKHSMGCPIRSEIWGMLCPGLPEQAAFYAGMDGSLDHHGFSVHAEQYLSVCASLAFYSNDIKAVLRDALQYIPENGLMFNLVKQVFAWHNYYSFDVAAAKIKSYYGDADFTSAPMNIAFTILTLLYSNNDFSCIAEALHMGHDSDCVVATAGALIGIIKGYNGIPGLWKERVGNEVLISEAITGIHKPATIEELTELTCREGLIFYKHFSEETIILPNKKYHFSYTLPLWSDAAMQRLQTVVIQYLNTTKDIQKVSLRLLDGSFSFQRDPELQIIYPGENRVLTLPVDLDSAIASTYSSKLEIWVDGKKEGVENVVLPNYGSWLLLGPFIEDNPELEPCDMTYPDHGMSGLPSVQYMNHDKISTQKEFLSQAAIAKIVAEKSWHDQPFNADIIRCSSFQIPFKQYYGSGERTIYLYSELQVEEEKKVWLSMGCTAYFSLFINKEQVYKSTEIKRCWPGAHTVLHNLKEGKNTICIRLDSVTDETRLEFGLKNFSGQHPHQSQWSLDVPSVERLTKEKFILATVMAE